MKNNRFFIIVLRSLGFTVYSTGARVSESAAGGGGRVYRMVGDVFFFLYQAVFQGLGRIVQGEVGAE